MSDSSLRIFTKDFLVCAGVNFFLYVNYYVLMVVMAGYCVDSYGSDVATAGFAASVFIVGALAARFVGGGVIDRFGRKRCLVVGTLCMAVLSLAYMAADGVVLLLALRCAHGFAYGVSQTAVTSLATESVPRERKGEGVGYYMLSVTVGAAVGPFLGTTIVQHADYAVLFALCGCVALASFVGALAVHEAPLGGRSVSSTSSGRLSLSRFIEYSVVPVSFVVALAYLAYGAVITYLNSFAAEEGMMAAASLFFVVYSAVMFVSRPFTGRWFDKRGDLGVMAAGFAAFALGMVCTGLAHSGAVLLAGACLIGFGVGSVQPSGLTLAVQKAPDARITLANSTYFVFLDAAIGLSPIVMGWAIPFVGYGGLYCALAGVVVVSFVAYVLLRKRSLI